ncbi:hypothetical protein FHS14_001765 [Paenibacillus baekrokdamisoli]|nr:hypothetical protein [Paenibacillus baekrokdamisoli]MBB3068778.1 hypothetical protein [Paenibacillus baekrokdamisoli]
MPSITGVPSGIPVHAATNAGSGPRKVPGAATSGSHAEGTDSRPVI